MKKFPGCTYSAAMSYQTIRNKVCFELERNQRGIRQLTNN
jgi:hypothetical protein